MSVSGTSQCDTDSDYDLENVSSIPVHITTHQPLLENMSKLTNPPPWYEHYMPRVFNHTESNLTGKQSTEIIG